MREKETWTFRHCLPQQALAEITFLWDRWKPWIQAEIPGCPRAVTSQSSVPTWCHCLTLWQCCSAAPGEAMVALHKRGSVLEHGDASVTPALQSQPCAGICHCKHRLGALHSRASQGWSKVNVKFTCPCPASAKSDLRTGPWPPSLTSENEALPLAEWSLDVHGHFYMLRWLITIFLTCPAQKKIKPHRACRKVSFSHDPKARLEFFGVPMHQGQSSAKLQLRGSVKALFWDISSTATHSPQR